MSCYDNIIGLSRSDCPCIEEAPDVGYNTSTSGLYLTDLAPLDQIGGYEECGVGSVWELLELSREEAVSTFIADTNALLMRHFSPRRELFTGQIGEASGRETLTTSNTYAGIRIACNPMRGGRIKITKIGTLFSGAGTLTLTIYNSLNVQVWSGSVNISNGWNLNVLNTPIVLPAFIEFSYRHEYFITYTYNAANKPRLNTVGSCGGCGFLPWYDTVNPMWNKPYTGGRAWANWVMVGGWSGDSLSEFDIAPHSTSTNLNGLAIQVELGCDVGQVLCNGSLDFTSDPFALSMAFAIRYKAAEVALMRILTSTKLNRANMINREALQKAKVEYNERYVENVKYITQEAPARRNDCLVCRDDRQMRVQTMLS